MRIPTGILQELSDAWIENDALAEWLRGISCLVVLPCGEEKNPRLAFWFDFWRTAQILQPEPIVAKDLVVEREEGCYRIPTKLSTAIVIFREMDASRLAVFTEVTLPEEVSSPIP